MRIKFPESRRNWHDIYRDPMEERLFCFNDGPSGGDEPDGVTFTSGDDYTPGQGIQISSSTLGPDSTEDTYRGLNTSTYALEPFGGAGASIDDITSGRTNARGESLFTSDAPSVAAPGALASQDASFNLSPPASPLQNLTAEQRAIVETARMMGEGLPDFSRPMTEAEKARDKQLTDIFSETNLDPAAGQEEQRARNEQQIADRAAAIDAINAMTGITRAQDATAQNVLSSGISALDTTDDARARATRSSPAFVSGVGDTAEFGISRPDIVDDAFTPVPNANITRASYDPSVQDEEQTSALSDDFLDERGRADVGILGQKIADYYNNPIVEAGQFVEGLFKSKNDMGGMSRPDSLFTDKAGLPSFGSLGDMTKAVQAGGRLTTDEFGNPLFVTMPDGSTVGGTTQASSLMTGGGGGGSATAPKSPMDPCPPGYKMVDGVCQPTGQEEGGGFQTGSGVGDTRFSPFYTPQQVGDINPFVLQPYRNES